MANENRKFIQLFRNQLNAAFADKAAAKAALEANNISPDVLKDGMPIIARYETGDANNPIKTLLGIAHSNGSTVKVTVFDSSSADALNYDDSAVTGNYVSEVDETNGIISVTREELPTVAAISEAGKPITAVSESLGAVSATAGTINAEFVNVADSGEKFSGTTVEAVLAEIDDKYKAAISGLDYTDTAVEGEYVSKVDEVDGVISVTREALPSASTVSGDSKVVIDVTQDKGAITATAANLTGVKLDGYAEGSDADIAATDTLGEALGKLQAQINAMDKAADAQDGQVVTTVTEADGKVTETKANVKDLQLGGYQKDTTKTGGIASGDTINDALSKLENKAAAVTIIDKDGSINVATGASGTEVDVNIKSGEKVLKKDGGAGIYTDIKLKKETGSTLPADIKERYTLVGANDAQLGEITIDVPKDSHIVSITYITDSSDPNYQKLEYKYIDVSGNTQTTYVDMSELVLETEFASGVTVTDHIAHGVVDPTSESFLTVGADGFKVSGVSGLVTSAIEALDVTGDTAAAGQYVAAIQEADGIVSVKTRANVSEAVLNNYSKGSDSGAVASTDTVNQAISKLENRVDAAKAAATKVEKDANASHLTLTSTTDASGATVYTIGESDVASASGLTELSGKTVTEIGSSNSSITVSSSSASDGTIEYDVITDGSKIELSGYTKAQTAADVAATDSVNEAIGKLEKQIDDLEGQSIVVTADTANTHVTVSSAKTGDETTFTVNESDIASASALTDEITARKAIEGQSGDTYSANTAATYISGARSLNNADVLLDAAIASVDTDMLTGVTGSNAISASTKSDKGQTISLILDDRTTSTNETAQYASATGNALKINDDGLYLDSTWDCGFYSSPANP